MPPKKWTTASSRPIYANKWLKLREDVAAMPDGLREIVTARIASWFVDPKGRDRTFREVRRFDDPRLDLDDVADAAEELIARSTP